LNNFGATTTDSSSHIYFAVEPANCMRRSFLSRFGHRVPCNTRSTKHFSHDHHHLVAVNVVDKQLDKLVDMKHEAVSPELSIQPYVRSFAGELLQQVRTSLHDDAQVVLSTRSFTAAWRKKCRSIQPTHSINTSHSTATNNALCHLLQHFHPTSQLRLPTPARSDIITSVQKVKHRQTRSTTSNKQAPASPQAILSTNNHGDLFGPTHHQRA
jgi:hypothetical protein